MGFHKSSVKRRLNSRIESDKEDGSIKDSRTGKHQTANCMHAYSTGFLTEIPYYQEVAIAGRGSFGLCIKAIDLKNTVDAHRPKEVAIKLLPRGSFLKGYASYVKREVIHQSSINHPQVVSIREFFLTKSHVGIVMDYAGGGDLHSYLQAVPGNRLSEGAAKWFFQQLIIGVEFCHRRGIANRDLKLENLLLDTKSAMPLLKIADFGFCKHELDSCAKTSVGTAVYMPPEVITCNKSSTYDAKKGDIWACGIILYAMLYGRYPFDIRDPGFMRKMVAGDFNFLPEIGLSDEVKDLISKMLVPCPIERASIECIMSHPWFLKNLPDGALDMNDRILDCQVDISEETIHRIESLIDMAGTVGQGVLVTQWFV